jgi:hypothetical protein
MPQRLLDIQSNVIDRTRQSLRAGAREAKIYTATNSGEYLHRQTFPTSETTVNVPSYIGDAGVCEIENLDATNYVEVGLSTGVYFTRIPPGQSTKVWLPPATSALYVLANTAGVEAAIALFER